MKKWQGARCLLAGVCAAWVLSAVPQAEALVLRGQFPARDGMYWNFKDNATQQVRTWAVLGHFARSGVGSLIVMGRQGEGFLALREEWDGLYLHGEYRPDGFSRPETPLMFMPFEIGFDKPVTDSARMHVHAAGPAAQKTGEYDRSVTITLQGLEDIEFEGREIRNCAVLIKKTTARVSEITETFWLAPSIGPLKMRVEGDGPDRTYNLQSYRTGRGEPPQEIALDRYFPLRPETDLEYRDQNGELITVQMGSWEERLGRQVIPYTEPSGDVYYLCRDKRGLVFPMKYVSSMGFAFVTMPPDRPPVLMPDRSAAGRLNHSLTYVRPCQWPSLKPMLDFYPELEISSVIVGVEEVTVPAGTYRNCIKLFFSSVNRSFNMQREKIRTGFMWFAPEVGEVKRETLSFANAYLDTSPDHIFQVENWKLSAVRRTESPKTAEPAQGDSEPASRERVSADDLVWQGISRKMFEAAVDAAPFFVRGMVRKNLLEAVSERADGEGRITEDAVIAAVEATTPEQMRASLIAELEQMRKP